MAFCKPRVGFVLLQADGSRTDGVLDRRQTGVFLFAFWRATARHLHATAQRCRPSAVDRAGLSTQLRRCKHLFSFEAVAVLLETLQVVLALYFAAASKPLDE
jgi:hypothetical protein